MVLGVLAASISRADIVSIPGPSGGVSVTTDPIPGNTLWYNGNPDGVDSFINQNNAQFSQVLYNQFNVTDPSWLIQSVWSNNIFIAGPPASTNATWEIWSGAPGGTLIASGDDPATLTQTGFTLTFASVQYPEYMVQVSGLNVQLNQGTYWLAVYPDNTNGDVAGNDTTSGDGAVGTPAGNGTSYFTAGGGYSVSPNNTSAGVAGTALPAVPEPSTMAIAGLGALGLMAYGWRRRARA
jgi:hypothetical protein